MKEERFKVTGMSCGGCVSRVTKAIEALPGIEKAEVSLEKGEAFVIFDEDEILINEIKEAVTKAGYPAE